MGAFDAFGLRGAVPGRQAMGDAVGDDAFASGALAAQDGRRFRRDKSAPMPFVRIRDADHVGSDRTGLAFFPSEKTVEAPGLVPEGDLVGWTLYEGMAMSFQSNRRFGILSIAAALIAVAALASGAHAASRAVSAQARDYGDLYVLYRDANGVPILTPDLWVQPLAPPGVTLVNTIDGTVECVPPSQTDSCVIPVDPASGEVVPGFETYVQEVDFGRTSVVRAPPSMLASQLEEAVFNLQTADCKTLDPAGRLVTSVVESPNEASAAVASAVIDSPLQNLAIYKQLMLYGYLGPENDPVQLPGGNGPRNVLMTAARSLGAAADKSGKVTVDMVEYINQFLGLADENVTTYLPKTCIAVKKEVQGQPQIVTECFLDYSAFGYNRLANFAALPYPAYIPAGSPKSDWFEYLSPLPDRPLFRVARGPILLAVPQLASDPRLSAQNVGGFVQAADDARAVIDYAHTWPVPGDYATPVPCTAHAGNRNDVSISEESGLQVPTRMMAGTVREFSVTVANAGPDAAIGTVTLTAIDSDGVAIADFPKSRNFDIPAGGSQTWTGTFTVDYATTVTWTATAEAANDVNPNNNSATKTTQVLERSGNGAGGG